MAFFILPYVLFAVLPSSFVGLSWAGLALLYYLMSKLLNNKKYRMMAVSTLILTSLYLAAFGITSADITYKIISFLAVSIILLIISVMYTRMRTNQKTKEIA
jgi:predicted benzoate:H+ symporter BenE